MIAITPSITIPPVLQNLSDFCEKNKITFSLHGEALSDLIMESMGKYCIPDNFIYECLVIHDIVDFMKIMSDFLEETKQRYSGPLTTVDNVIESSIQNVKFRISCGIIRGSSNASINATSMSYKIKEKKLIDYELAYKDIIKGFITFTHHNHLYMGHKIESELFMNPITIIKLIRLYCKYNKNPDFLAKQPIISLNALNKCRTHLKSASQPLIFKQFCKGIKESQHPGEFIQLLHSLNILEYILPYKYNYVCSKSSSPIVQIALLSKGLWSRTKHKKDFLKYLSIDLYWSYPLIDALYFLLRFCDVFTIEDIKEDFSNLVSLREKLKKDFKNIDELLKEFTYNSNCIVNRFLNYERAKLTNLPIYNPSGMTEELEYSIFMSQQYK